jgi:hypothetical protein
MASNNPEREEERWERGHKATTERDKAAMPARVQHCMPVRVNSTMIAAAGRDRTFAYSDADWRKIKASLAPVGIDADTVTVGDQWWAQPDPKKELITTAPQRPLREQLQEMAADYRGLWFWHKKGRSLTPKQEAGEIRTALDALEVAYDKLSRVGFISYEGRDAREAITTIIAKTKRRLKILNAEGSSSSKNARKVHIEYWGKLVLLWQTIIRTETSRLGRWQRKEALSQFLLVCSERAFPEEMQRASPSGFRLPTTKSRIASFLNKHQTTTEKFGSFDFS